MKKLIHNIKLALNLEKHEEKSVNCNYSDNYYGDQYCQPEKEC